MNPVYVKRSIVISSDLFFITIFFFHLLINSGKQFIMHLRRTKEMNNLRLIQKASRLSFFYDWKRDYHQLWDFSNEYTN